MRPRAGPMTVLALLLLLPGCGGSTAVAELAAPSELRCTVSVAAIPAIPARGGAVSTSVTAARECAWAVNPQATWFDVVPATGQGPTVLRLEAGENTDTAPRTATLMINGIRVAVSQEPASPPPPPIQDLPTPPLAPPAAAPAPSPPPPGGDQDTDEDGDKDRKEGDRKQDRPDRDGNDDDEDDEERDDDDD